MTSVLDSQACIVIFAREPVSGHVKTRLEPALGADGCLQLYQALLQKTVQTVSTARLAAWQLWVSGDPDAPAFARLAEAPLRHQQHGEDLGLRMLHAASTVLATPEIDKVVLVGTDCPAIDADYLQQALALLDATAGIDVVLGPAEDGGYVLLGMTRPVPEILTAMEWGQEHVLSETVRRLQAAGIAYALLPERWDVDRPEDLHKLRSAFPELMTAAGLPDGDGVAP